MRFDIKTSIESCFVHLILKIFHNNWIVEEKIRIPNNSKFWGECYRTFETEIHWLRKKKQKDEIWVSNGDIFHFKIQ